MIKKYKTLNGAKYFSSGILQNYSVFISANKYFKFFSGITEIYSWKSNGMSEENIENITTSDNNVAPTLINSYPLPDAKFNGLCLINNNISIVISLYIFYTLRPRSKDLNIDLTLNNFLFGSVKLNEMRNPINMYIEVMVLDSILI